MLLCPLPALPLLILPITLNKSTMATEGDTLKELGCNHNLCLYFVFIPHWNSPAINLCRLDLNVYNYVDTSGPSNDLFEPPPPSGPPPNSVYEFIHQSSYGVGQVIELRNYAWAEDHTFLLTTSIDSDHWSPHNQPNYHYNYIINISYHQTIMPMIKIPLHLDQVKSDQ